MTYPLRALLTGQVKPLGRRGAPSGIAKSPVAGPIMLGLTGFEGDAQGDTKHHGGPEKAVHHYPFDHYATWTAEIGTHARLAEPGAFGENLSTLGLTEDVVAIGDVFSLGGAVLEVSQGRQPCWKLNERFNIPDMARRVQTSGRTGWYYRVLQPGAIGPTDRLERIGRADPSWTLRRIWHCFYVDRLNPIELEALARLPKLAEGWRRHAERRLETQSVEDWTRRLDGQPTS
ncbi:MOSC domain-containing protein [Devosia sp. LjRoot3]|uniref:MOSC domain-containing protein n=1 Tax=Devosia sp. LjRoot3 TaxID=3342319 RepID=UPI003ECE4A29